MVMTMQHDVVVQWLQHQTHNQQVTAFIPSPPSVTQ